MGLEQMRREAEQIAHDDMRAMVKDMVLRPPTCRDLSLQTRYQLAERIIDAIDAYQRHAQESDPEAPDYATWSESEKAGAWGR